MKRYLFCFAIIIFVSSCKTLSIPNNEPLDHILLVKGDTLFGEVDYFNENAWGDVFYKKIRLIDTNGRKRRYKREKVVSFRVDGDDYESFRLEERKSLFKKGRLLDTKYSIEPDGTQHFLKVRRKGKLAYYELEFQDWNLDELRTQGLVKKVEDKFFIRAEYAAFGIARKLLNSYLSDCPEIQEKLMQKDFKQLIQVVDFYNEKCVRK